MLPGIMYQNTFRTKGVARCVPSSFRAALVDIKITALAADGVDGGTSTKSGVFLMLYFVAKQQLLLPKKTLSTAIPLCSRCSSSSSSNIRFVRYFSKTSIETILE